MPPGGGTSLQASQSIASSAKSGVDSQGSSYSLESGKSGAFSTGAFSVGGSASMNNQLLIIAAAGLAVVWFMFKK